MKPILIKTILDMALEVREQGRTFNPLFTGEAGLGKSEICQEWVRDQKKTDPSFGFIDLRIAYMEAPDMIGFPETEVDADGLKRTVHGLPEFWPTSGRGLILLEEPNRGTTGVMNTLMQILTDRKVHNYEVPNGWIVASCINPDSAEYDVNAMDAALKNRFEEYEIEYDHNSFVEYMEKSNWHDNVKNFVKSGMWVYKESKSIGREGKYLSPRTWSKMNAVLNLKKNDLMQNPSLFHITSNSILGKDIGKEFHKFCFDDAPVTAADILNSKTASLKKLKKQGAEGDNYRGDMIAITVESIIKNYQNIPEDKDGKIGEDTMAEIASLIPSDQAINMIKECGFKHVKGGASLTFFAEFTKRHPELIKVLKSHITISKTNAAKKQSEV
jgi:hypothetical protein